MKSTDLVAFKAFVASAGVRLHRAAYQLCGDWHLAEDLVQESLLALYRQWPRLDRTQDLYPYLHQTMVNMVRRELRRAWRRHEYYQEPPEVPSVGNDSFEVREALLHALARLGPRQRAVLVLRYYEDHSVHQTAQIVRCSPGTVRSQTSHAMATLRSLLGPTFAFQNRD